MSWHRDESVYKFSNFYQYYVSSFKKALQGQNVYESGKFWFKPDLIYVVNCVAFWIDKYL